MGFASNACCYWVLIYRRLCVLRHFDLFLTFYVYLNLPERAPFLLVVACVLVLCLEGFALSLKYFLCV